jgi:octopine/nopaline transport system substrate-binding protein
MSRRTLALLTAVVLVALAGDAQAKEWKRVKIATEGAYAPWNFTDPSGKLVGFEVDLANDLCKRMKTDCEIVAQNWDGIIPGLTAGKYDAIMAGMSITAKRMEVINFSNAYAVTPAALVTKKGGPLAGLPVGKTYSLDAMTPEVQRAIDDLKAALKGKAIGVQVATTHSSFLETYFKGVADIRTYKTTEQHDLDLETGRIDVALASIGYWKPLLDKPEGKNLVLIGPTFRGGLFGKGVGVGLRKGDPELLKLFNDAIAAAAKDGTLRTLALKWFKFDNTPE